MSRPRRRGLGRSGLGRRGRGLGRAAAVLGAVLLGSALVGGGFAAAYAVHWGRDLPDYRELDNLTLGATTRLFARDQTQLGTLIPRIGDTRISRTLVRLEDISPYMSAAIIANEDRRFFDHYGMDPIGILRQFQRILRDESLQGGSTLTNQLVKNTLLEELEGERSLERKVKEWMLSLQLERSFTKSEVLQNYLNVVYWGDGGPVEIFGVYGAARAYFGKHPRDLTLEESLYLATLVPRPIRYFNYEDQRTYMGFLLERMVEDGWVTRAQADAAWRVPLQPNGWEIEYDADGNVLSATLLDRTAKHLPPSDYTLAPHFIQQVERELIARFGRERVYGSGGLNVYTTLLPRAQIAAEAASRAATIPEGATLGMALLDPFTGDVIAMVGQKIVDGEPVDEWNNAAQGQRQVGSSVKPFLYTTALSAGIPQTETEDDKRIELPCEVCEGGVYVPRNFDNIEFNRPVSLRFALNHSLNRPTIGLAERVGLPVFNGKLRELGFNPDPDAGISVALGTLETTPLGMAAAYAPFVNGGMYRAPRYITRVTTATGEVLFDASTVPRNQRERRVWSEQVAYLGLDMLLGVVNDLESYEGGLATRARIPGWEVGGKTGTTNEVRDTWFVGFTPAYVGAVWVGRQAGGPMPWNTYSGITNTPIWRGMMEGALAGLPPQEYRRPPGIVERPVFDLPASVRAAVLSPAFAAGATTELEPEQQRPVYREAALPQPGADTTLVALDRRSGRLAGEFTPPEHVEMRRVALTALPSLDVASDPPLEDRPPVPPTAAPAAASPAPGGAGN